MVVPDHSCLLEMCVGVIFLYPNYVELSLQQSWCHPKIPPLVLTMVAVIQKCIICIEQYQMYTILYNTTSADFGIYKYMHIQTYVKVYYTQYYCIKRHFITFLTSSNHLILRRIKEIIFLIGRFPIGIQTEIRYLIICGSHNFMM